MKKSVLLREGVQHRAIVKEVFMKRKVFLGGLQVVATIGLFFPSIDRKTWKIPFRDYRLVLDSLKLRLKSRRTAKDREVRVYTLSEMQLA